MNVVFADVETTGLLLPSAVPIAKQPQILELFALTLKQEGDGPDATFSEIKSKLWMFNPGVPISKKITQITSITDADVKGAPRFAESADEVIEFFGDADRVVAHNLYFDQTMITIELKRAGKKMNWPEACCTVNETLTIKGYRLKLIDLHEYLFGEPFASAHRAENDVRALARCYCELVKRDLI